jgi:hypothetical protein
MISVGAGSRSFEAHGVRRLRAHTCAACCSSRVDQGTDDASGQLRPHIRSAKPTQGVSGIQLELLTVKGFWQEGQVTGVRPCDRRRGSLNE